MNDFRTACRVRSVDATPLPLKVPGAIAPEFSFPGGFITEGTVYLVERVSGNSQGRGLLRLVGHPVPHRGVEIAWNGLRVRRPPDASATACLRSKRESSKPREAVLS